MGRTEAQIAASRANGMKSRGPNTLEGKAISRQNALKHGMTGEGIVLPIAAAKEVERRAAAMLRQMQPTCEMGAYHVRRLARLTVRVEVCADTELAAMQYRADHAEEAFDEARLADVDHTLSWIGQEPATYSRKLRSMPEGIDRMIAELLKLHGELNTGRWNWFHGEKVSQLMGDRWMEIPVTRVRAVSEAINGKFDYLNPEDGAGLSKDDRIDWARDTMGALIEDEMEALLEHRKTLDFEAIERDRAGAAKRSAVDASKEAILARRYEAAAERAIFKTMDEFRLVEAEAAELRLAEEAPPEVSGSFGEEPPKPEAEPEPPVPARFEPAQDDRDPQIPVVENPSIEGPGGLRE